MDSGPGDEMLLLAVAERDMGAFRTLYERHAGWLAIRLTRRCNDRDLVADAIQDTFVLLSAEYGDIGQALARLTPVSAAWRAAAAARSRPLPLCYCRSASRCSPEPRRSPSTSRPAWSST